MPQLVARGKGKSSAWLNNASGLETKCKRRAFPGALEISAPLGTPEEVRKSCESSSSRAHHFGRHNRWRYGWAIKSDQTRRCDGHRRYLAPSSRRKFHATRIASARTSRRRREKILHTLLQQRTQELSFAADPKSDVWTKNAIPPEEAVRHRFQLPPGGWDRVTTHTGLRLRRTRIGG